MQKIFDELYPMLLKSGKPFDSDGYIFEIKLDGVRCLCLIDTDKIILKTRNNRDITSLFPELCHIYKCIDKPCILDGELVMLKNGKPDFYSLLKRTASNSFNPSKNQTAAQLAVFDILYLGNKDLTRLPLLRRKQIIKKNITPCKNLDIIDFVDTFGNALFDAAKSLNLEGIVAKKKDSIYQPGIRSDSWVKIKVFVPQEFLVLGFIFLPNSDEISPKDIIKLVLASDDSAMQTTINISTHKQAQGLVWAFYMQNRQACAKNDDNYMMLPKGIKCQAEFFERTESGKYRNLILKDIKLPVQKLENH